ncbi:hypothetical protein EIP91_010870 [Steccherinum ochraceum]|uniref:Transmembrane protein n=1 Tax=Steccherinum ochraceum TaxID=92696 RepID=A0A4R0R7Y6_9APHY|nr:hypothetical protein EIP91_010870 [Steccherinum ochraceum]
MSSPQTIWRPFLLFRSVLFALLTWFNVIAFGFAVWYIISLKSVGVSSFGPPVFVIVNACATFLLLLRAISELCIRNTKTAQVSVECAWTFVMAVLQFAGAVDITVMGPPQYCGTAVAVNACAASTVLVIATWLSSVTMMLYFLSLYMTAIAHYWVYGGIWGMSVYEVPWFSARDAFKGFTIETPRNTPHDVEKAVLPDAEDYLVSTPTSSGSLFNYSQDNTPSRKVPVLVHAQSKETLRPTWAKSIKTRRGVDQPFSLPGAGRISRMIKACMLDSPPAVPPKAKTTEPLPKLDLDLTPRYPSYSQFPVSVYDEDRPIKTQRLSQWVKAGSF